MLLIQLFKPFKQLLEWVILQVTCSCGLCVIILFGFVNTEMANIWHI